MTGTPWLTVIGIGELGAGSLAPAARAAVEAAEVLIGDARHLATITAPGAERHSWPSPFDDLLGLIEARRGRRVVVLATGDPLWFSVGARLARRLPAGAIAFHPQVSAFQWAACRMGWSLADLSARTAHGRPARSLIPDFWPGARLLVLTSGPESPGEIARLLVEQGYPGARLSVLADLGGTAETRLDGTAGDWAGTDPAPGVPPLHVLAVEVIGRPPMLLPRVPGLPDAAFTHDGKLTKREVRALTLARLMPERGGLLWDLGTGCGSVAIEWMRAAPEAQAIGIDTRADRLAMARENAERLGTPRLKLVEGRLPEALADLPPPEAVFIGGGLSEPAVAAALAALRPGGRLVANAVTLESEALLIGLHARHGGDLARISVARASPVGGLTGWRPAMPVTQWSLGT